MFRGDVSRDEVITAMSTSEDEEGSEELPNEQKFTNGITLRSRGTVQHDIAEWKAHKAEFSANHYTLAIASYERWQRTNADPVLFVVVFRIEKTRPPTAIYAKVKNAIVALEVQART
jgi:hypothetical protein